MCSANLLDDLARADVGVWGFTAKDLTPRAVAVTPYLIGGKTVVTTTLALLAKAKMLRSRPAAALLAGGLHVSGDVSTRMHRDPDWFDANLREFEARKYPPAKSLLSFPFHRRLLWWYVGRVAITFDEPVVTEPGGGDRVTLTSVVEGRIVISALSDDLAVQGDLVNLDADVPDGPGCLLVHHETVGMEELLSLTLRGEVTNGQLAVASRHGSLEPQNPGTFAQLRSLCALSRLAKANRSTINDWPLPGAKERR